MHKNQYIQMISSKNRITVMPVSHMEATVAIRAYRGGSWAQYLRTTSILNKQ